MTEQGGERQGLSSEDHEATVSGAVAQLHRLSPYRTCMHCTELAKRAVRWPCPTMAVVGVEGRAKTKRPWLTVLRVLFAPPGTPLPAGVHAEPDKAFSERMPDREPEPIRFGSVERLRPNLHEIRMWRVAVIVDAIDASGVPVRLVLPDLDFRRSADYGGFRAMWSVDPEYAKRLDSRNMVWIPPTFW